MSPPGCQRPHPSTGVVPARNSQKLAAAFEKKTWFEIQSSRNPRRGQGLAARKVRAALHNAMIDEHTRIAQANEAGGCQRGHVPTFCRTASMIATCKGWIRLRARTMNSFDDQYLAPATGRAPP